jgi:hypothetical protein
VGPSVGPSLRTVPNAFPNGQVALQAVSSLGTEQRTSASPSAGLVRRLSAESATPVRSASLARWTRRLTNTAPSAAPSPKGAGPSVGQVHRWTVSQCMFPM